MRRTPVPTDDLSSIPGLEDKHLRALARRDVTDLRSFADADQREIYKAMENIRPRPSRERISRWQQEARSRLEEPETDASDWHAVASFVVVFAWRQAGDAWERRVEVERTEVEPEQDIQVWVGWDFEPVGTWITGQLRAADSAGMPAQPVAAEPEAAPPMAAEPETAQPVAAEPEAAQPVAAEPEAAQPVAAKAPERSQLRIDSAAITDANRTVDVVAGGALVAGSPPELTAPVRMAFTVSGARPGTELHAVTRILRPDGPGWNPQDPVVLGRSGQAEFDLSAIPADQYEMSLIAWAPDATAKHVSVRLPALTIRPGRG
jgi:cell division septation protein DedD